MTVCAWLSEVGKQGNRGGNSITVALRFRAHPQCDHEFVVAPNRLGSQLPDLGTRYHRFCLSVMRVPYRSGNPLVLVGVYRE